MPLLAPISFVPSLNLKRLRLIGYGLFALSFGTALWPFLSDYPALMVLLVLLVIGLGYWLKPARQAQLAGTLAYSERGWVLQPSDGQQDRRLQLKGEVLIWSGLVILPFWDMKAQRLVRVVIAADSVSAADFARLRTWLRRNLVPKA